MKSLIFFLSFFLTSQSTVDLKSINYNLKTDVIEIVHKADTIQNFFLIDEALKKIKDTTYLKRSIIDISDSLKINYKYLMLIIHYESRFDTLIKNPYSSAKGLIQFIKSTRNRIGLTDFSLKSQLQGILTYLSLTLPDKKSIDLMDVYLAIHYPIAINREVVYQTPSAAYSGNSSHDLNKDGIVTRSEIRKILLSKYDMGI